MAKLTPYQRNVALIAILMIIWDPILTLFSIYQNVWIWVTPTLRYDLGSISVIFGVCAIVAYAILRAPTEQDVHVS